MKDFHKGITGRAKNSVYMRTIIPITEMGGRLDVNGLDLLCNNYSRLFKYHDLARFFKEILFAYLIMSFGDES